MTKESEAQNKDLKTGKEDSTVSEPKLTDILMEPIAEISRLGEECLTSWFVEQKKKTTQKPPKNEG